jgi:type I restriction enzyme S subunit
MELERYRLRAGDILFSRMATVGRAGLVRATQEAALFNYHLMRLRLRDDAIDPLFFIYYVRSSEVVRAYVRSVNHGMTRDGINTEQLVSMPLPVAPRNEQRRIVEAIEDILSRLDAAVANLEAVQRKLKAYRASVLNAAVQGRLVPTEVETARKEGRSYEVADVLLERILKERRLRWEQAEQAKMRASGKVPKDDRWKAQYEEPTTPDTAGLPGLPEGWCWTTLDQVSALIRNGHSTPPREAAGVRTLRISSVRPLAVDFNDARYLPGEPEDYAGDLVDVDDLLFTRYNGTPSLVGVCGRVRHLDRPTIHPDKLIKVRLIDCAAAGFIEIAANVGASRSHIERRTRTTAGQAGISGADLKQMPVPLPPIQEQRRVAEAVDALLTTAAKSSLDIDFALQRSRRLRQAVLAWAFDGKLVDDDPADEPAEALFARLRAERPAAAATSPKAKRPRRLKAAS